LALLSATENTAYWDARHEREGDLRSGGDVSFDEPTNQMFYVRRLAIILDVIGHHGDPVAPLFVLDAGCGKGWFSRQLAAFGHRVDAIDTSESAIRHCRERGGGPRFFESSAAQWRSPWLYDAVVSIDVAFHILDDQAWEQSMSNLASLVRMRGLLIVSDWGERGERQYGDYQIVRGRDRYLPLLRADGLTLDSWRPYNFRHSPIGFYVFRRTS
jgi:SAM-dependent methyltransferase